MEDMFRKIKDCDSVFKNLGTEKKCDPSKLKDVFEQHFNNNLDKVTHDDVLNADFIGPLQDIPCESINSNQSNEEEITDTIKSLKRGKAATDIPTEYMKAAIQNKQFLN